MRGEYQDEGGEGREGDYVLLIIPTYPLLSWVVDRIRREHP